MKKTQKILIISSVLSILAVAAPGLAAAEENPTTVLPFPGAPARQQILERNRDIRNDTLKQHPMMASTTRMGSTTRGMMIRQDVRTDLHDAREAHIEFSASMRRPAWLAATSSAPWMKRMSPAALKALQEVAAKHASTTPEGHEAWKNARLDLFASMQSNLITQTQHALQDLRDLRTKIADRIQDASQKGRDMTEATRLLAIADQKIASADAAITAVAALTPSFAATSTTTIDVSSEVSLEGPRKIGHDAIQAVNDVRKALNDVVLAIAHSMRADGNASETTTTATTTQQ